MGKPLSPRILKPYYITPVKNYWPMTIKRSCNGRSICCAGPSLPQNLSPSSYWNTTLTFDLRLQKDDTLFLPIPFSIPVMRKMALEECNVWGTCSAPERTQGVHLVPGSHWHWDRPSCQHFEEMTVGILRMRLFVLLGTVSAAPLLPHPAAVEPWDRKHRQVLRLFKQPHASSTPWFTVTVLS